MTLRNDAGIQLVVQENGVPTGVYTPQLFRQAFPTKSFSTKPGTTFQIDDTKTVFVVQTIVETKS